MDARHIIATAGGTALVTLTLVVLTYVGYVVTHRPTSPGLSVETPLITVTPTHAATSSASPSATVVPSATPSATPAFQRGTVTPTPATRSAITR